jgi:hypothetical protein
MVLVYRNTFSVHFAMLAPMYLKEIANHSKFNSQHEWGDLYDHYMNMELTNILMNSKCHEGNGYKHNVDLLILSHLLGVSFPMRSGCREWNDTHLPYLKVFILIKKIK